MSKRMTLGTGFEMDCIVPWGELGALIWPVYPKAREGRPPKELEMMLRIYFLQQWFNLSDPGVEEALYDSLSMRRFAGIDLGEMPALDESTVCRFRHLLEAHGAWEEAVRAGACVLGAPGHQDCAGTIVDATIISAPPSTKNEDNRRDPDMHQTKKRESVVFRDESQGQGVALLGAPRTQGAHRRGQPDQGHPCGGRHPCECARLGVFV